MKKLLAILTLLISLCSCNKFGHEEIWDKLQDHEERILELEEMCSRLNENIVALQAVLTALECNDYVTDIVKVMENGVEIGYSITFAKGGTVTIYHGNDGTDGSAPKIGIQKASDGEYYWTSDGEWLTDEDGAKIPAVVAGDGDGRYITPQFRIAEGEWYISYDNGNSWKYIGELKKEEPLFSSVNYDEDYLTITLADGTVVILPRHKAEDYRMSCVIMGNLMYVRAKDYRTDVDMVWTMRKERLTGNRFYNLEMMSTCPTDVSDSDIKSHLTKWKSSADDIGPPNINGTYIAGNHGYFCVDKITATGHGKTTADIGSVWSDAKGRTYVLVFVYDVNTLGFVMFNQKSMESGKMGCGNPEVGTEMTHVSGATSAESVTIEAVEGTQVWKCWNNYTLKLFVDGVEQDLSTDKIVYGNRIEFVTDYNTIYIPAMLEYLMANVGNNTDESHHSDEIADYYFRTSVNYQFNRNGSMSQYNSHYFNKDVSVGYIGLVQSMALATKPAPYTYVPDTQYDVLTPHDGSTSQYLYPETWRDQNKVPYRYYQFIDETADKGMCLAYDRTVGWGSNEMRLAHTTYAGFYYTSRKMYPAFISGGKLTKGTFFDGLAARIPLYKYDEDLTAFGWYWCGEDIILMIDTHNSVNKEIALPDYMNNTRIEVLDKSESVDFGQTYVFNGKLRFKSEGYGFLVVRLYK